jgi:hypothetical protein
MAQTFPGSQENLGRHVSIEKYQGGTQHPPSEWTGPKTIFKKKRRVCVFIFVLFYV